MRILNFLLYIFFYFPNSLQWACIIFINTSLLFRLCHIWLFAIHGLQCTRLLSPSLSPKSLLKLRSIEPVMPSNRLILCRPLLLLPSIFPSIRVVSNESSLHIRWSSGASWSILPMNIQGWFPLGLKGLISFQSKSESYSVMSDSLRPHGL